LTLTATLKNTVPTCGDIRTARASFYVRSSTGTLTPINGAQNLPVGLVNPGDLSVGTASANVQYTISGTVATLNIAVLITGNYSSVNNASSDAEVTVAVPVPGGLIVGGGLLCNDNSAGYVKGATATITTPITPIKTEFSFYVQYNKSLTNQQGGAEITVRSYNDRNGNTTNTLHIYKIRSNAISGLLVTTPKAEFNSKANISEIVNGVEQSIEGNCIMQLSLFDGGDNGGGTYSTIDGINAQRYDSVAIIVYRNKGGVWYSNNWNGTQTLKDKTCGGEVSVYGAPLTNAITRTFTDTSATVKTVMKAVTSPVANDPMLRDRKISSNPESFKVTVAPNPSTTDFKIKVESNSNELINIRIIDAMGRVMGTITGVQKGSMVTLGGNYRGGSYFAEVVQGANHKTVKLIKLN
jgi:hypothetical protein